MARTTNDWLALEKAERDGREPPGTYARLWAEEHGEAPPVAAEANPHDAVMRLAELLSVPAAVKARIADLKKAEETARAEVVAAGRERAAVAKLREDAQAEYREHQERMAFEREHHESWMAAARAELQAEVAAKTQAIDGQLRAVAAERAALKQKADALRQHLESAA